MPRKPIEIETRSLLTPRERVWNAVRKLRKGFTVWSVQEACEPMVNFGICRDYMRDLEKSGYIKCSKPSEIVRGNCRSRPEFDLVKNQHEAPRLRRGKETNAGIGNQAMWAAMKVLKRFTSEQVAQAATLGDLTVSMHTATMYLHALSQSGHLALVKPGGHGVCAVYALKNYTGPKAPALTSRRCVFDRNTGEIAELQTAQEVADGIEA